MSANIIPLETVGADIKARVEAGDKALDKAEQHFIAAGIQLAEAKKRLAETREMTWPAFLNSHCSVRRRRADELIALGEGRKSLAEMREKNRERVAAHRERKKSEPALRNAEPTVSEDAGEPVYKEDARAKIADLEATVAKLREQLAKKESQRRMAESEAKIATRQRDEAQNRAMYAEADKERLEKELAEARAENARLLSDIDMLTKPATTSDEDFDPSKLWLAKDAA